MCIRDRSKIKNEILITFDSSSTRDFVFSHSKNLSKESNPNRVHGLRLDYPAHLGSDYRALDGYGAKLRREVGTGFRRNIRFNDDELGLVMDINFPKNPDKWIRVSPKLARENGSNMIEGEDQARELIKESLSGNSALSGVNAIPVDRWRMPTTNNLGEPMT